MTKSELLSEAPDRSEQFVALLKRHERQLNGYVLSLVHNWNDADDIVQDVAITLWQQFDQYDPGSDFGAWGCTIAYYKVLTHRKKKCRQLVRLSEKSARLLAEEITTASKEVDGKYLDRMIDCLHKLPETDQTLLRSYYKGMQVVELSQQLACSTSSIYKHLSNLRHILRRCVDRADSGKEKRP